MKYNVYRWAICHFRRRPRPCLSFNRHVGGSFWFWCPPVCPPLRRARFKVAFRGKLYALQGLRQQMVTSGTFINRLIIVHYY